MRWLPPDDVLQRALTVVAEYGLSAGKVCVVRDYRGRVRVAVEKKGAAIETKLTEEIGAWFAGPVVDRSKPGAHKRIAAELLEGQPLWPAGWPTELESPDGSKRGIPQWLIGRVVLQSKESWLGTAGTPPPKPPRVVSFYSFKGGVGRTTTLGCVAARLVKDRGLRIVAVDLDLEAPGTGSFLGVPVPLGAGVMDHLLSHLATGDIGDVNPDPVEGFPGLWVMCAGALGPAYLEKLARLDFLATTGKVPTSPAEDALRELLVAIHARIGPDLILLDSRAGLHDIGGLALHRLSHTDVLVARANAQAREGTRVVLDAIRRFRKPEDRDVRLVQTMVPLPFDSAVAEPVIRGWRSAMYEVCIETIYNDLDDMPAEDQQGVAHYPLLVAERTEFSRTDTLSQVAPELLPAFDPIADVVAAEPESMGDEEA